MNDVFARKALLLNGWADNVRLGISAGRIQAVAADSSAVAGDIEAGIVIPGLANAHSHAFQRALAGRTEQRSPRGKDSFWTWRERMYALAGRVDAAALTAIASQAYAEMLTSGYTAVAEFHYLHREPGGNERDDVMFQAIAAAATTTGIRLTYVPVLYERADFDQPEPRAEQKLFAHSLPEFLDHQSRVADIAPEDTVVAIGAHSLRAVTNESLQELARIANQDSIPLHLHIAEQQREVEQCLVSNGRRPVRFLLENFDVAENWCLVHATHMDREEIAALAASNAVVCLCPSTEANLGDGLFPLQEYLRQGGVFAIGSDSHITINPFEELRWLEYGQRLASQSRNVVALQQSHVGRELFERALTGGAQATGCETAGLRVGANADLIALNDADPMLLGHKDESLLDALVFAGYRLPIERVMVRGQWQVEDGGHVRAGAIRDVYASTLSRLGTTT